MNNSNIFEYVETKEAQFNNPIDINGWQWSFKDHVKTSFYYKHGRLLGGNDDNTPVKNITRPIVNLQYRAEDIDVKDVVIYVDDPDSYHLSFLVKKYHDDVFVLDNDLDTFFDEVKESKIDYGGGLAKKMAEARPERVDLQSIAFCDQSDMMTAPIGLRHNYSPSELKDMEAMGWGNPSNGATISIDDLIELAEDKKVLDPETGVENETTGTYVEIYEIHGVLPKSYLTDKIDDEKDYKRQMHIIGFYHTMDDKGVDVRRGVHLFRKEEAESPFKLHKRDEVYSRTLGYGGIEEIFEDQVWTNYDVIRMNDLLDAASKTILKGIGTDIKTRYPNGLQDVDNLQILELGEGEDLLPIDTTPRSMALFDKDVASWEQHAQRVGSATDPLLGEPAPSGTPFRAQERQVIEGKGIHEYRRGKFARFLEEIYRDWIIPHIMTELSKGAKFLSELSLEEMRYVVDQLATAEANKFVKEQILSGKQVTAQQVETLKQKTREKLVKGGNKKFVEILKGEFKNKPLRVKVSIAGKGKDLAGVTDKLVNIFRQIIANPEGFKAAMQIPEMARTFNDILEFSGMTPAMYAGLTAPAPVETEPAIQQLQQAVQETQQGVKPELERQPLSANQTP